MGISMTQEERNLLLKEIGARIHYGVKILHQGWNYEWDDELSTLEKVIGIDGKFIYTKVINNNGEEYTLSKHTISLYDDKIYLFPLSSMTEEQKIECFKGTSLEIDKYGDISVKDDLYGNCQYTDLEMYLEVIEWLNKNHFDYRGLIEKGLAIDATDKIIY